MVGTEGVVVGDRHGDIRQPFYIQVGLGQSPKFLQQVSISTGQHGDTCHLLKEYNSADNVPALTKNYKHKSQRMKIIR